MIFPIGDPKFQGTRVFCFFLGGVDLKAQEFLGYQLMIYNSRTKCILWLINCSSPQAVQVRGIGDGCSDDNLGISPSVLICTC